MFKKKEDQELKKKFKEGEYSEELKQELDELHKFKWSHVLWPLLSIILISGLLFYVYKNYIVNSANTVTDRKNPEEKIKSKPETTPEVPPVVTPPVEAPKPAETPKEEPKKAEVLTTDYTIKEGDTIGAIANSLGLSSQQVLDANPGLVAESVQVGQVIKIPKQ